MSVFSWITENVTGPALDFVVVNTFGREKFLRKVDAVGLTEERSKEVIHNFDTGMMQTGALLESGKPIEAAYNFVGVSAHSTYSVASTVAGNSDDGMEHVFGDKAPEFISEFTNKAADAGHEALHNTDEFVVAYLEGGLEETAAVAALVTVDLPNLGVKVVSGGEYGFDGMAYEGTKGYMDEGFQWGEKALTGDVGWDRENENLQASRDMGGFAMDVGTTVTSFGGKKVLKEAAEVLVEQGAKQGGKRGMRELVEVAVKTAKVVKNAPLKNKVAAGVTAAVVAGEGQKIYNGYELEDLLTGATLTEADLKAKWIENEGDPEVFDGLRPGQKIDFLNLIKQSEQGGLSGELFQTEEDEVANTNAGSPDAAPDPDVDPRKPGNWFTNIINTIVEFVSGWIAPIATMFGFGAKTPPVPSTNGLKDHSTQAAGQQRTHAPANQLDATTTFRQATGAQPTTKTQTASLFDQAADTEGNKVTLAGAQKENQNAALDLSLQTPA